MCVVLRHSHEKIVVRLEDVADVIPTLMKRIHEEMYQKAVKHVSESTRVATDYETLKQIIATKNGYVKMMWCEDVACENKIKEDTTATMRCLPFEQEQLHEKCCVCGRPAKVMVYVAKAY